MEFVPQAITQREMYKVLTGTIVPRPIGWISSQNVAGQVNLAPFSYFNAMSSDPPIVVFGPGIRAPEAGGPKDTWHNVRAVPEFVVNIVTETLAEAMNQTATELPPDVDEFQYAGLTPAPSVRVRPPRVAESPVHFECVVRQIVDLGDRPGSGSVVIGEVVHVHIDERVLEENFRINLDALQPIGRLAGNNYTRTADRFTLVRPPSRIRKG